MTIAQQVRERKLVREHSFDDSGTLLLRCAKCREYLPYFAFRAQPYDDYSRASWCIDCNALRSVEREVAAGNHSGRVYDADDRAPKADHQVATRNRRKYDKRAKKRICAERGCGAKLAYDNDGRFCSLHDDVEKAVRL